MLATLIRKRDTANAERQRLAGEVARFRRLMFTRATEAANLLWPMNTPITLPRPHAPFAPSNLWGLCGPESHDDEDEGKPSIFVIIH